MITQIDIFNFKALRAVSVPLSPYQLLIGPNGTGKSSVFDAILLLRNSMLGEGPQQAVKETGADSLVELTHCKAGGSIGISVLLEHEGWPKLRYTVTLSQNEHAGVFVEAEAVTMITDAVSPNIVGIRDKEPINLDQFRQTDAADQVKILKRHAARATGGWKRILYKTSTGADTYIRLADNSGKKEWSHQTLLAGPKQLTLKYSPSERGYEYISWVKESLLNAPIRIQLDIGAIRSSGSPEKSGESLTANGDNFANVIEQFKLSDSKNFKRWLSHVRSHLPEIADISTLVRPDNKKVVVQTISPNSIEVPQYLLSDGTLRFLALTLLAYSSNSPRFLLIEEPENGLHPRVIEGVLTPFKISDEEQQVLFASHSPIVLANFNLHDVVVFQKPSNSTELCNAMDHPAVQQWHDKLDKASLLVAGIL